MRGSAVSSSFRRLRRDSLAVAAGCDEGGRYRIRDQGTARRPTPTVRHARSLARDRVFPHRDRPPRPSGRRSEWRSCVSIEAFLGRPPKTTQERLNSLLTREWGTRLIRSWSEGWMELPERVGDALGEAALGAAPSQVVVPDSTSVCLYKLLRGALALRPGRDEIVTDRHTSPPTATSSRASQRMVFAAGESPAAVAAEAEALGGSKVMLIASDRERELADPIAKEIPVVLRHEEVVMHGPVAVAARAPYLTSWPRRRSTAPWAGRSVTRLRPSCGVSVRVHSSRTWSWGRAPREPSGTVTRRGASARENTAA